MSLLDSKGRPVEMPSPMHTLNAYSIRSEWWHFNDADYKQYRKTDYDLDQLLKVIYD